MGFLQKAKHIFSTSSWITAMWEWFLSLATRAIQPVLFLTVMYNLASTYPGVKTPGPAYDLGVFIAQNAALDIASFGLPGLARQALQEGNKEGANDAHKLAKHLFYIMIANLVWGGVEHVLTSIDGNVKLFIALAFVILRSFYAIKYSQVIHALKASESDEKATTESAPSTPDVSVLEKIAHIESALLNVETTHQQQFILLTESIQRVGDAQQKHAETLATIELSHAAPALSVLAAESPQSQQPAGRKAPRTKARQSTATTKKSAPVAVPDDFDKRQFVFDCLKANPTMKISEMQQHALKEGHALSVGAASSYRKEYVESTLVDLGETETETVTETETEIEREA
jgi:hypothetical protein